jgi:malto-oligosyltrehalose trehalohydrolase
MMRFGPKPIPGGTRFDFWAPDITDVELLARGEALPMRLVGDGWFTAETPLQPGDAYAFRLSEGSVVPDPASRAQQGGVHGPSLVPGPIATDPAWRGRPWHEAVLYELHLGTFTPEGTLAAAAAKLPYLADLGITAVELMPLAAFAGSRGWGYDGVLPYAVHESYGTPEDLAAFVARAHAHGLMVFLDVVYNHFGPDGNYLGAYASRFFRDDVSTPWGAAIDFREPAVRAFFIENALFWLETYGIDGLRLDAVHAIVDEGEAHLLAELARAVRQRFAGERQVHLVLENEDNIAGWFDGRYDAQWNDDWHHVAHVIATGETDGYYRDYAEDPVGLLLRSLAGGFVYQGEPSPHRDGAPRGEPSAHLQPTAFVDFLQNHDQIGNRAFGERLTRLAPVEAVAALQAALLLSPHVPLLFMGEEWGATTPFLFFCDFEGPLADAVREGRRSEFGKFAAFADPAVRATIPDPLDLATFESSRLDWSEGEQADHAERRRLVRDLLAIRREHIVPGLAGMAPGATIVRHGTRGFTLAWQLTNGSVLSLQANLGGEPLSGFPGLPGRCLHATPGTDPSADRRPAWSVAASIDQRP